MTHMIQMYNNYIGAMANTYYNNKRIITDWFFEIRNTSKQKQKTKTKQNKTQKQQQQKTCSFEFGLTKISGYKLRYSLNIS